MSTTTSSGGSEPRDPDVIEADIEATRRRLASTITQLQDRVSPRSVAQRSVASLRSRATTAGGGPRPELLAAAAVLVLGIVLALWRRRR